MLSTEFCTKGLLLVLIHIDSVSFVTSYSMSDSNSLLDNLFNQAAGYNQLVQPNKQVIVMAGYYLQSVNSLDVKRQVLSTTGYFILKWQDDRLKWNTTFGDIKSILVPEDRVWHPDLVVLNSINELQKNLGAERPVRIYKNGMLVWKPVAMLSTFCNTRVYFFPFDSHNCSLELTSLDLPDSAVCLTYLKAPGDTFVSFESQADWTVVETTNYYNDTTFCEKYPEITNYFEWYQKIHFNLELKRLPGHYIMIVVFPTILTAMLTYAAFFLPLKSGIRIGYIVTVVLAYVVLLTLFEDTLPSSTKFPSVLVVSFTITLGMAFLLLIITIFVTRLYNKPKRSIAPNWMHSLVRKARKLKLKCKCRDRRIRHLEQNQATEEGRPTEEVGSVEKNKSLKPYSNKELAEFFDYFLYVAFTMLYIFALAIIPIGTAVWYYIAKGILKYN